MDGPQKIHNYIVRWKVQKSTPGCFCSTSQIEHNLGKKNPDVERSEWAQNPQPSFKL